MNSILEMQGICKRFPGVTALDGVGHHLHRGEALGLIGENGAGKSTLMNILGGILAPDGGTVAIDGNPVRIPAVAAARKLGIAFIHQELNVLDNLDIAGNVFLGREPTRGPWRLIKRRELYERTQPYLRRIGLQVPANTPLSRLSPAQQQMVEIAKALSLEARILIMDEPTSSLTVTETGRLLDLVVELKHQGVSVIYISHRLSEIRHCADRVVALRDGRNAGELGRDAIEHDRMVRMMIGRDTDGFYLPSQARPEPGYLRVRDVRSPAYPHRAVSFDAARGEILGFAGLVGAGRTELAEAIFGLHAGHGGKVILDNRELRVRGTRDTVRHGIYLVPEDRRRSGLVSEMTVRENVTLPSLCRYANCGWVCRTHETAAADAQRQALEIKAPSVESRVHNLSGGNQQKVVLGKWLSMEPRVIIFDEPTRGIDVGAKAEIYRLMRNLAIGGATVLMISSDMEEILNVSDRVAVMHEGCITGVLAREHCTEENIMQLAVGGGLDVASSPVSEA